MTEDYREKLSLDVAEFLGGLQAAQVALGTFAGALAGDVLHALTQMVSSTVQAAREVGKFTENIENLSTATGISEQRLLTLESVMATAGGNVDALGQSVRLLAQHMVEADRGNVQMQENLRVLGVTAKNPYDALLQIADTLKNTRDGLAKTATVPEVLGRGFLQILPALKNGSEAFREAEQRAYDLGTSLTTLQRSNLKDMDDAFDRLGQSVEGLKRQFVAGLAPAIKQIADAVTSFNANLLSLTREGLSGFLETWILNLKATAEQLKAIGGAVFSGDLLISGGMDRLGQQLDAIQKRYESLIAARRAFTPEPDAVDPRGNLGTPRNIEAEAKALEAQKKLAEAGIEATKQAALDRVAFERVQIQERVTLREIGATRVAELETKANAEEIRAKLDASNRLFDIDVEYFRKRLQLSRSPEEKQTLEAERDTALAKRMTEAQKLVAEGSRKGLQDTLTLQKTIEQAEQASGARKRDNAISDFKVREDLRKKELSGEVAFWQNIIEAQEAEYATSETISASREQLFRAEMERELADTEKSEAEKLAIRTKYTVLIDREQRRQSGSFVEGWREGLYRYVNDTQSMFGMAVDMARQTAQLMQASFQRFFFDLFEGKVKTLKDLLRGFLDFVKQVVSQVMAQLATTFVLKSIASVFPGAAGAPALSGGDTASAGLTANQGGKIQKFAFGGPVMSNGDSVPAMLTPGEFVVSRKGVDALNRLNQGNLPSEEKPISVHIHNAPAGTSAKVNVRRELKETVIGIILQDIASNGDLRQVLGKV